MVWTTVLNKKKKVTSVFTLRIFRETSELEFSEQDVGFEPGHVK